MAVYGTIAWIMIMTQQDGKVNNRRTDLDPTGGGGGGLDDERGIEQDHYIPRQLFTICQCELEGLV